VDVDKSQLSELTVRRAADGPDGPQPSEGDIGRVLDLLFGTVEQAGTIAETLKAGEAVTLGSFGGFQAADGVASFRAGTALTEYLRDQTR
jgi:DNA-binding protein HU-beta